MKPIAGRPRLSTILIAIAMLLAAGAPARAWPAEAAESAGASSPTSLKVQGDRLFITVRLNGVETEDALLDSGAEMSLVDSQFASQVGLATGGSETARGTGGNEEVTFAEGVRIEAAGIPLADRTVAVLDLQDLSDRLIGAPVKMIVGRELFDAARLVIDISEGRIEPVGRDIEPPGTRLEMQTHKGLQTIPVSVEGGAPAQADFDLGNGNEVLIGAAYAERTGLLEPERIVGQKAGGGIGGEVLRDLIQLSELEIAGMRFTDVSAAIDRTEHAADVNVGVRILRNFRMTVDYAGNAIWLEPVASP